MNYSILIRDYDAEGVRPVNAKGKPDPKQPVVPGVLDQFTNLAPDEKLLVILDECQAVNNPKTKTWEKSRLLCDKADRVQGLTATPIGSVLMEAFGIYKVIKPELFKNKTSFMNSFCEVVLQGTPHSKQKIPIVTGYKNLEIFRESIDPFFLGRMKQDISDELPTLISRIIPCELSNAEDKKYKEALSGILELGDGEIRDFEESKALVALLYCQQVANSLSMLKYQEGDVIGEEIDLTTFDMSTVQVGGLSAKEQALVDLLVDGELSDQKVIVYTRFASLVPRLQKILDKHKIGNVRVTGKDSDKVREAAKKAFQDPKAKTKVIFVTAAGGVGINLQIAKALVFFELPWTWGDYVQILGRMIRIGSPHRGVVAYHLFAERLGGKKTIDHHVHKLLLKKKELIDKVIGEAAVGALEFEKGTSGSVKDLLREMLEDA